MTVCALTGVFQCASVITMLDLGNLLLIDWLGQVIVFPKENGSSFRVVFEQVECSSL